MRVCAAVTFARIHLIPMLPQFMAQHPELDLDVVLDDRQIDLVQEGIDVALRMGKMMDSTLTARRVAVNRRDGMTPPRSMMSTAYRADRRRDPTPIHTPTGAKDALR